MIVRIYGLKWSIVGENSQPRTRARREELLKKFLVMNFRIKPALLVRSAEDHRHPIVNAAQEFIGCASGNGKTLEQRAVGLFPGIPKSGEAKELAIFEMNQ